MALNAYETHTGLTVVPPFKDEDEQFVVVLRGDKDKELYRGNLSKATAVFNETVKHYKERKKAEA